MSDPFSPMRRLAIALIISGGLNVILIVLGFYWAIQEHPPTPYYELKPASQTEQLSPLAIDHSNSEVVRYFRKMPMEWLVGRLSNAQLVENGYSQRDLALASLIAFHNFDIDRALAGYPQPDQKRSLVYGKFRDGRPAEFTVYPGLSEKQYEAIRTFAATERWPLTSKGLLLTLRKGEERNPSLVDAFLMTPEFLAVKMLFERGEVPIDKTELLEMLLQGDWTTLSAFATQQRVSQDLSTARRQRFLLDYIQQKSKSAAYIILKTDGDFASRKLDDGQVLKILELLDERRSEAEQFAVDLLTGPRSDAIWKLAAMRLYEYHGESLPEPYSQRAALSRFVPHHTMLPVAETKAAVVAVTTPKAPPPASKPLPKAQPSVPIIIAKQPLKPKPLPVAKKESLYIVQEGDSLWKIAKRFNVDVDVLRSCNHLDSDALRPGRLLRIP